MKKSSQLLQADLLMKFLDSSPTAWHAVENCTRMLKKEGFVELREESEWDLVSGEKYFITRNGSSICAFIIPSTSPKKIKIVASHTDSPALKLKPNSEFSKENMTMLGVEVYGAPLLASWLNRDLGIAGRVIYVDEIGAVKESLVNLDEQPVIIPQLAIHLDRQVNEAGLILNKQDHLSALAAVDFSPMETTSYLEHLLKQKIQYRRLLGADLFLYPLEKAAYIGHQNQLIASYRIDSLASVHSTIIALSNVKEFSEDTLNLIALSDNEEVGSETTQGAGSPFLQQILERIFLSMEQSREEFLRALSQSQCLSVDLAHGLHPNHSEKHDSNHQVLLNKGIVIKSNANQRYASDAKSISSIVDICLKNEIPYQYFVSRNDIPCGSTIGPIHATKMGISTVDIGVPQLSMHSSREILACEDQLNMSKLLTAYFENK